MRQSLPRLHRRRFGIEWRWREQRRIKLFPLAEETSVCTRNQTEVKACQAWQAAKSVAIILVHGAQNDRHQLAARDTAAGDQRYEKGNDIASAYCEDKAWKAK